MSNPAYSSDKDASKYPLNYHILLPKNNPASHESIFLRNIATFYNQSTANHMLKPQVFKKKLYIYINEEASYFFFCNLSGYKAIF